MCDFTTVSCTGSCPTCMCLDTVLVSEDEKELRGEEKEREAVEKSRGQKRKQTKEEGDRWQEDQTSLSIVTGVTGHTLLVLYHGMTHT